MTKKQMAMVGAALVAVGAALAQFFPDNATVIMAVATGLGGMFGVQLPTKK